WPPCGELHQRRKLDQSERRHEFWPAVVNGDRGVSAFLSVQVPFLGPCRLGARVGLAFFEPDPGPSGCRRSGGRDPRGYCCTAGCRAARSPEVSNEMASRRSGAESQPWPFATRRPRGLTRAPVPTTSYDLVTWDEGPLLVRGQQAGRALSRGQTLGATAPVSLRRPARGLPPQVSAPRRDSLVPPPSRAD